MSEKQTIGDITPKTLESAFIKTGKSAEETIIRTMQKDIDSLRERNFAGSPQNLPVIEESAKNAEAESKRKLEEEARRKEKKAEEKKKREEQEKIKEQKRKEEKAREEAKREQKRKLRALKIIAFKAWLKTNSSAILKFSFIGIVIALAMGIIGGFFYWWNYIRTIAPPVVVTHYQCREFQCVSVEGRGVNQCQNKQDCQPAEPEIPQSLIPTNKTEIIEIEAGNSKLFTQGLKLILAKEGEAGAFNNILIKIISQTEKKYADLSDFLLLLRLNLPEKIVQSAVVDELGGANYTFFLYNQIEGKRLGLVVQIAEEIDLKEGLKEWEESILEDISALFSNINDETLLTTVEEFQDNIYNDITIRYLNLPNPDLTIDYAIVGDKLIITTSKESMYAVIDGLLSIETETAIDFEEVIENKATDNFGTTTDNQEPVL